MFKSAITHYRSTIGGIAVGLMAIGQHPHDLGVWAFGIGCMLWGAVQADGDFRPPIPNILWQSSGSTTLEHHKS